jgi:hypothetical protein
MVGSGKEHLLMNAARRFRPSAALVVASLALLVALAETGWATMSQLVPNRSVGTAQLRTGAVTTTKVRNGAITSAKIRNGSIRRSDLGASARIAGPRGRQGPAGPAGSVSKLWAVASSTGALVRSAGTTSAGRVGNGQFEVVFNQDIANCSYLANVGATVDISNAAAAQGFATVGKKFGTNNTVRVNTRAQGGGAADRSFHLVVVC